MQTPAPRWKQVHVTPKFRRQILQSGERAMLVRVEFNAGADLPDHSHVHEQITCVVSGSIRLRVDGVERVLRAGDSIVLRSHVPHGVSVDEPAVVLDLFSPPREDFLASDPRVD